MILGYIRKGTESFPVERCVRRGERFWASVQLPANYVYGDWTGWALWDYTGGRRGPYIAPPVILPYGLAILACAMSMEFPVHPDYITSYVTSTMGELHLVTAGGI